MTLGLVRPLKREDLKELVQLLREHARFERSPWLDFERESKLDHLFLTNTSARCWVIELRDSLIGFATASMELSTWDAHHYLHMDCLFLRTHPATAPAPLLTALGLKRIVNSAYNEETKILLLEVDSAEEVAQLDPDFVALRRSHDSIHGVLVTAKSNGDGYDFHSRYFWPWSGSDEDPVTGGTHTFLAKYWSTRLNRTKLKSFQSSKRTGFMDLELRDGKLFITCQAIIILEGELRIAASP